MPASTISQQVKNTQAQVAAWDAQIERYTRQANSLDEYTKQAFLDELVHLQAKRDQFAETLATNNTDDSVANEDTEDEKDWNKEIEHSDEELEQIKIGTVEDLDDDSSDEDDDEEENEHSAGADDNQQKKPEYTFTELIHTYTTSDTSFREYLVR